MKTKFIIIGGFLGAGKTTLLKASAELLQAQGRKVGLITNDQAEGLVDTHILSGNGSEVQEITGSCLCCNFNALIDAALYLRDAGCDTIIAEPVGSCTDVSATILQAIKSYHLQYFDLLPFSVLVDPIQIQEMLDNDRGNKSGSAYIYLKQLEEADYIVVNKIDLLSDADKDILMKFLEKRFAGYQVKWISSLTKNGLESWLESLNTDTGVGTRIAEVDYDIYAEGEARMGWYNAEFTISHTNGNLIPWADFTLNILHLLQEVFNYEKIVIGHVKAFLKSGPSELQANLTGVARELRVTGQPFSSRSAHFILNIRAEANPDLLKDIMEDVINFFSEKHVFFETVTLKYFQPGRPEPTHRLGL